jgi:hypothetical protein
MLSSPSQPTIWDVTPDGKRFLARRLPAASQEYLQVVMNWFEELRHKVPPEQ